MIAKRVDAMKQLGRSLNLSTKKARKREFLEDHGASGAVGRARADRRAALLQSQDRAPALCQRPCCASAICSTGSG